MIDPDLWLHVRCCPSPYRVEYLRKTLSRAKEMGFTGVFIEYEANFLYVTYPRLSDAVAYLRVEFGSYISSVFKPSAAKAEEEARYTPWLEALGA